VHEQHGVARARYAVGQLDPRALDHGPHAARLIGPEATRGRRYDGVMEGGFGDMFGDPEELQRRLAQFAEQMQGQQALAWADNAIKLAVDLTVAAINRVNLQGNAEAQAEQIRSVMAVIFPEAVTLVREAREGLQ
jgi:hypothetical protein